MGRVNLQVSSKEKKKILSSLKYLGMHRNEIYIYLDLLNNPNSSALEISKRTAIHRSNTYDAVRSLIKKGFVKQKVEENKKRFSSINPDILKKYMKKKEKRVNSSVEILKNSSKKNKNIEEGISIIKGVITLRGEIDLLIKSGKPIFILGADEKLVMLLTEGFLENLKKESIKEDFEVKILRTCPLKKCDRIGAFKGLETRYLEGKNVKQTAVIMCGDVLIHLLYKSPPEGIKIANRDITLSNIYNFERLWKGAKSRG